MIKKTTLICISLIVLTVLWRYPFAAPLYLDETLSAWIVSSNFSDALSRAFEFQAQSPFYFIILWIWKQVVGGSDLAYRILSIVFCFAAAVVFYDSVKIMVSAEAAIFSLLVLVAAESFTKAATGVRPYGLALLFAFISIRAALLLKQKQSPSNYIAYATALVLTWYSHYLFISVVFIHLAIWKKIDIKILTTWLVSAVLALPGLYHLWSWQGKKELLAIQELPTLSDFIKGLVPLQLLVYFIASFLVAAIVANLHLKREREGIATALTWGIFPPVSLFIASYLLGSQLFLDRYYLWHIGGIALLCGSLFSSIQNQKSLFVALAVFTFLAFFLETQRVWMVHDWRGAIEFSKGSEKNLAYSGLIEAENTGWISEPSKIEYLLAPFQRYGTGEKFQPISFSSNPVLYLKENPNSLSLVMLRELKSKKGFIADIVEKKIVEYGYDVVETKDFGIVRSVKLKKRLQ